MWLKSHRSTGKKQIKQYRRVRRHPFSSFQLLSRLNQAPAFARILK